MEKNIQTVEHTYTIADTEKEISDVVKELMKLPEICFDTETTGLEILDAQLVGIALSGKPHEGYYIPMPEESMEATARLEILKPLFENPETRKIGQNIKFDVQILQNHGVDVKGDFFDTMLAHYLIQPERRHNLSYLAESYLEYSPVEIEELIGEKEKNQISMRSVPVERIAEYACEDADITLQLMKLLERDKIFAVV